MKSNFLIITLCLLSLVAFGQKNKNTSSSPSSIMEDSVFTGMKFRSIGPAFMSGRISDIAIDPSSENTWYVSAGSGGLWKTQNAGVTWTAVFENQTTYSIGCVTVDPNSPNVIWVGTGENVGGRHVGFGDGVYKSVDAGKTWKNAGLKTSEHISEIIVNSENSNIIYLASQGPLWSKGGERGFYLSTDAGQTWKRTLGDDEWTGVTDIAVDPRNSDRVYAATWQRHRTVAAYMGGGPKSSIHRSEDGGKTWTEVKNGLPTSNMGKIGIAISPQQPDIIYAAIELDNRAGGVYKSTMRGNLWEKQSDAVSGATGPHYYQELYASPHKFDKIYLVDVRAQVSEDGGKTFRTMSEDEKHSDNHAIAFKKSDPDYILVGTDGGLYESFDGEKNWRFFKNLPITQFYKVALDDSKPFYNIYGGTQDNNTQGGPSRTDNAQGIQNSDWKVVLYADGHQPATEPGNPDIMYAEWQEGHLNRIDLSTGENVSIQPQPEKGEDFERFNWDAPILVSPHDPKRIYFASQRVWKSDNRGDKWTAISGDLTKNQERMDLPIMGRKQSYNNAWDYLAMSNYNTITSLAESPKKSGLLYAGTDDGLIQISEDGGQNWRKIAVSNLPGAPSTAFVNDIKADLFDESTVYVCLDNHKYGDFKPYLYTSSDKGKTWKSLKSNLPAKTLVWRIVQDHVNKDLFFLATEFGIYFSINSGQKWVQLKGGLPTISFRDLAIQRRENDLVGASFGRSFYVLDDYTPLRQLSEADLNKEALLFPGRKAWWYFQRPDIEFGPGRGSQGADYFLADNPPFGANFTYYLKETVKKQSAQRQEKEKKITSDIPFPGWDKIDAEDRESDPKVVLTIRNEKAEVVNRVYGPASKGFNRVNWDLTYPASNSIDYDNIPKESDKWKPTGMMCAPGKYSVSMSLVVNGKVKELSTAKEFVVERLYKGALEGSNMEITNAFWREYETVYSQISALNIAASNQKKKVNAMHYALMKSQSEPGVLDQKINDLKNRILDLDTRMFGQPAKLQMGEKTHPDLYQRIYTVEEGISRSAYGPTDTHRKSMDIVKAEYNDLKVILDKIESDSKALSNELRQKGAPYIEGSELD